MAVTGIVKVAVEVGGAVAVGGVVAVTGAVVVGGQCRWKGKWEGPW